VKSGFVLIRAVRGKKTMTNVTFFKANHTPAQYMWNEEAKKSAEEADNSQRGFRETAARYRQAGQWQSYFGYSLATST
jgi:hypothetical protein